MMGDLKTNPPEIPCIQYESYIGQGGMSVVWKAWHTELNKHVAVKILKADCAATGKEVRQFMVESRTMSSLHHPGIVQGYGAEYSNGHYALIMDYVDGYSFASLLNRKHQLPQIDALIICESVANAMKYAWDTMGIVHCDIKPDNIMVDRDGTIKVMDLGLCLSTAAFRPAGQLDEVVGTPAYISPEQVFGDVELDCRADIYSLGATLYHLVTGRMLFPLMSNDDILRAHVDPEKRAPDPRRFASGISGRFARLLEGMLIKDRDGRYQTWDDVYAAAQTIDANGDLPPLPEGAISSISLDF